jgi:hypothetical protein
LLHDLSHSNPIHPQTTPRTQLFLIITPVHRYFGEATGAAEYFAQKADLHCPKLFNPSDFFLDILRYVNGL